MRMLTPPVKTSLVFGAGLAMLIGLLNFMTMNPAPQQPFITARNQPVNHPNRREQIIAMNHRWSQLLAKYGYQPGPGGKALQPASIFSPKPPRFGAGHGTRARYHSDNRLILPATSGPGKARSILIELGSSWKGLALSYGVLVTGEFWGYSNSRLWLKMMVAGFSQQAQKDGLLPFGPGACEITFVQPFQPPSGGKFFSTGWLPSIKPIIPVQRVPVEPVYSEGEPAKIPRLITEKPAGHATYPKAAIIIDDVGYWKEAAEELVAIPVPLTWAILPFAPYSEACRKAAQEHGIEIILHLPMEPAGRSWNPGPGAIIGHWSAAQIRDQLEADLDAVPGVVGINNHMGSAGTQDQRLMGIVMAELKQRKLFFVDSRTHALSVAEDLAYTHGVPFAGRRVFIDNKPDPESHRKALRKLIQLAIKEGTAVGIAHARPASVQSIAGMCDEFQAAGVKIVPVSELVK